MADLIRRSFDAPDETMPFPGGRYDIVRLGGVDVARMIAEPGWRYTSSLGEPCRTHHAAWLMLSGRLAVRMADGTVEVFGPGEIGTIPPGHDAWVEGDEPVVAVDFYPDGLDAGGG